MSIKQQYIQASIQTADELRTVATSPQLRSLSMLSLPEIDAAVDAVARILPAGNVPSIILSGLARLPSNRLPQENIKRDVNLLFKAVSSALDKAVYGAFFAGPAAVIWGYQNLLRLAGKSPEDSFPEGLWQFYVDYALREDTARFTLETHGFDTILEHHHITLSSSQRMTAWVMAAIQCLHQYDALLTNEWRERVYVSILQTLLEGTPAAELLKKLMKMWATERPYGRQQDAKANEHYAHYRHRRFDEHLRPLLDQLDNDTRQAWYQQAAIAKQQLPLYQKQMSILAYLEPTTYGETRHAIDLKEAQIALVYQGRYYLIAACQPHRTKPPSPQMVQRQVNGILEQPTGRPALPLSLLAPLQRNVWAGLRHDLNATLLASLEQLRRAPIILNMDIQSPHVPLAKLRQTERGVGDHPLTIFDTQKTFVFDHSHIFFDGTWSAAFAEILTQEALAWGVYLRGHSNRSEIKTPAPKPLPLPIEQREALFIQQAGKASVEVNVETTDIQLKPMLALRKMFKMRNDLLDLTVNDLFILYRAIHAATYQMEPSLAKVLARLKEDGVVETAVLQNLMSDTAVRKNPAILIPIDASRKDPKERVFPLVFEVPIHELDLIALHKKVLRLLADRQQGGDREVSESFDQLQRRYLATLAGFGKVLKKAQEIAVRGEGTSQGAMKLLAHMPTPLQRLLDNIPNRFDVLNDLIKGREVFSNLGVVAPSSSLCRFCTAKDDNEKKSLSWAILTDVNGIVHLSLRDFRPHVAVLVNHGHHPLATEITQHYVEAYANGLNRYIKELSRIVRASPETQLLLPAT